jgi:hypothetical protein
MQIKLFVCCHKRCNVPKSDVIIPVQVGKALTKQNLGFIGDDTDDNISQKNPYFSELTTIYWIWKNIKADVVGLFHYRRFLNLRTLDTKFHKITPSFASCYGITQENISNLLSEYDVILPFILDERKDGKSVYDIYKQDHVQADMDLVLEIIKKKYPEMSKIADEVINYSTQIYACNIIIAKKLLFDKYATWLFDILFEVEKNIQKDVLTRNDYQKRVYGFLSERMMRIFIEYEKQNSNIKIKEVPMLYEEGNKIKWFKYKLKRNKRKLLSIVGLGKPRWKRGW